jgi:hypothetical protein
MELLGRARTIRGISLRLYLSRELGMTVRANHLGIALQRHRRAGRLDSRDSRWYLPKPAHREVAQPAMTG